MSSFIKMRAALRAAVAGAVSPLVRRAKASLDRHVDTELLEPRQMFARTNGLDVSHYQGVVDWSAVRAAGYEFSFVKATEGVGVTDASFTANMNGGAAAGMLMAAYHHATPSTATNDALNEANYFVQQAGQYMKGGWLRPALDLSAGSSMGKAALSTWVDTFATAVQSATGVRPIIYSNNDYVTNYLTTAIASANDLWISRWSSAFGNPQTTGSPPTGVWGQSNKTWSFWQYTNAGSVSGISTAVDLDVFNGDRTNLQAFVVPPPSNSFQLNLDFGPAGSPVPDGYVSVGTQILGSGSPTMGWLTGGAAVDRRTASVGGSNDIDERVRTNVRPYDPATGAALTFEVAVPNGTYLVHLVAGSPDQPTFTHKASVEGVTAFNYTSTPPNAMCMGTVTVNVTDGYLTIAGDAAAPETRLDFVDIVAAPRASAPPAAPSSVVATRGSGSTVSLQWTDNSDNEGTYLRAFKGNTSWDGANRGFQIKRRTWTAGVWGSWAAVGTTLSNGTSFIDNTATQGGVYQYRVSSMNAVAISSEIDSNVVIPPIALKDDVNVIRNLGAAVTLYVLANDSTSPTESLSITNVTQPTSGTVSILGANRLLYTPESGFTGAQHFTYTTQDTAGRTASAQVDVNLAGEGEPAVTEGLLPGTKRYITNDGFAVDPNSVYSAATSGNYAFTATFSNRSSHYDAADEHGDAVEELKWYTGTLSVRSSDVGGSWIYSESLSLASTSTTAPQLAGHGTTESVNVADVYTLAASGLAAQSTWSFNANETLNQTGSYAGSQTGSWYRDGIATQTFAHASGASTSVSSALLDGHSSYTFQGSAPYSYDANGGSVTGSAAEGATITSSHHYDALAGVYAEHKSNTTTYTGSGNYGDASFSGSATEHGDAGSSSDSTVTWGNNSGNWTRTGGVSSGNDHQHGHVAAGGTGSYSRTSSSAAGHSSMGGSVSTDYVSDWDAMGSLQQTLNANGSWTMTAGSKMSDGTIHDLASHTGSGSYSITGSGGLSGSSQESGVQTSDSTYDLQASWVNGTWVSTGTNAIATAKNGVEDSSGSGSYQGGTTSSGYNSSTTGTRFTAQHEDWDIASYIVQTMGSNGSWSTQSGSSDSSGSSGQNWSYSGAGTFNQTTSDPASAGYQASSNVAGSIIESGSNGSTTSYGVHSDWAGTSWVSTGHSDATSMDAGQFSSEGAGQYTRTFSSANSHASSSGTKSVTHTEQWNSSGDSHATLVLGGGWSMSGASSDTSDASTDGWNYQGSGTYGDSNTEQAHTVAGVGTVSGSNSGSGSTAENGSNTSSAAYVLHSQWSPSGWTTTGDSTAALQQSEHYSSSGTGEYTKTTTAPSSNSSTHGNTENGSTADWTSKNDTHATWSGAANNGAGDWVTTGGAGTYTGTQDDHWSYSAHGTYTDSKNSTSQGGGGSQHNDSGGSGHSDATGSSTTTSNYTLNTDWSSGAWHTTGDQTWSTAQQDHSSLSGTGHYTKNGTTTDGSSTITGTSNSSLIADSAFHSSVHSTWSDAPNNAGSWHTAGGDSTSTGKTNDGWSYSGNGTYQESGGGPTVTAGVTFTNTSGGNGAINESGDYGSSFDHTLSSNWSNGSWHTTGDQSWTMHQQDQMSSSGTGTFTQAVTAPDGGLHTSGSTGQSHTVNSTSNGNTHATWSAAANQGNGDWVLTTGTGSYSGGSKDSVSSSGQGTYTGSETPGTITRDNSKAADSTYTLSSTWGGTSWTTTGTSKASALEGGHWSTSGNGTYSRPLDGGGNESGSQSASHASMWSTQGSTDSTWSQQSDTDGSWVAKTSNQDTTRTLADGWSYSGHGNFSESGVTKSITEEGHNNSTLNESLHSTWTSNSSWSTTGNATATSLDGGSWMSSSSETYSRPGLSASGGISSMNGNKSVSHGVEWTTQSSIKASWSDTANDGSGDWIPTNGTGSVSYFDVDKWSYSGSGTYTESLGRESGSMSEDGTNEYSAGYSVNATLTDGTWHSSATPVASTLDSGHWSSRGTLAPSSSSPNETASGDHSVEWKTTATVSMTQGTSGTWAISAGNGTSTSSAVDNWSFNDHNAWNDGQNDGQTVRQASASAKDTISITADWNNGSWHMVGTHTVKTTDNGNETTHGDGSHDDGIGFWGDSINGTIHVTTRVEHVRDWGASTTHTEEYDNDTGSWTVSADDLKVVEMQYDATHAIGMGAYERPMSGPVTVSGNVSTFNDEKSKREFTTTGTLGPNGVQVITGTGTGDHGKSEQTLYMGSGSGSTSDYWVDEDTSVQYSTASEGEYTEQGEHSLSTSELTDWTLAPGSTWTAAKTVGGALGKNSANYAESGQNTSATIVPEGGRYDKLSSFSKSEDFQYAFSKDVTAQTDSSGETHVTGNAEGGGMAHGQWKKKSHIGYTGPHHSSSTDTNSEDNYNSHSDWFESLSDGATNSQFNTVNNVDGSSSYTHSPSSVTEDSSSSSYSDILNYPGFLGGGSSFNPYANPDPYYGSGGLSAPGVVGPPPSDRYYDARFGYPRISGPGMSILPPPAPIEPAAPAELGAPGAPEDDGVGNPTWEAIKAVFGYAEPSVQEAYDSTIDEKVSALNPKVIYEGMVDRAAQVMSNTLETGGSETEAFLNATAVLVNDLVGTTGLVESAYGYDVVTGEALSTGERVVRGVEGLISTVLTLVPVLGWGARAEGLAARETASVAERGVLEEGNAARSAAKEACTAAEGSCFVAGTQVLLGDSTSLESIEEIQVGQRVATDGGAANSADGKTTAADPNATNVDPATWRLVTISAAEGDWQVQTLVPLSWLSNNGVVVGGSLALSKVADLNDMGVSADLFGRIQSIDACPEIEGGSGRVVLTTVSHSSNDLYTLDLLNDSGTADSIGITGSHRVFTEDRGWVVARELVNGEVVRTSSGNAIVTSVVHRSDVDRVYNLTVEKDHVYYVGNTSTLVHNACEWEVGTYEDLKKVKNDGLDAHHVPQKSEGPRLIPGFDPKKAPSIAVKRALHQKLPWSKYMNWEGSPAQLVESMIEDLRGIGAPEAKLTELRQLIRDTYGF